jgi:protease I
MSRELEGIKVALLVTDGFEEVEMTSPRKTLDEAGARTVLVSPKDGSVQAFKHHDKSNKFDVDVKLESARADDFDALVLPGGVINGDAIRADKKAQELVRAMDKAGKPIAVICHGGWILISAGLVKGRRMTSWPTLQDDLRNAGAEWADEECIRDRNWVSSRKPDDLPVFNKEMVKAITGARSTRSVG